MIDWLENSYGNKKTTENTEMIELDNLRKEMGKYKQKYNIHETEVSADNTSESSEDEEELDKLELVIAERKSTLKERGNKQRMSVSAEAYGMFNKKNEDYVPKVVPKSQEQKGRIMKKIQESIIFNCLEESEIETVIDAMEEKTFNKDDEIIRQGEEGDCLFLIESGKLDCYKKFGSDSEAKYLKTYEPGEAFGELALLYNSKRAASIIAKDICLLWSLDRETFNQIVKDAAQKKREKYMSFLSSVDIFSAVELYELSQVCDALQIEKFAAGDTIIVQHEEGTKFYLLESGEAYASKRLKDEEEPQIVKEYKKGGYFGELSLIRNEPRAASVVAQTECKLLTLDKKSFRRLLGSIEDLLLRNSVTYLKYVK